MCRDSPREQSPGHPRSTAPGDHDDRGPCGAMPMVPIISRGLEMSADAALVVAEHQRALHEVRHGGDLVLAEHRLHEGEDALRCRRGRRHREDDARRLCPSREARVVRAVEGEYRFPASVYSPTSERLSAGHVAAADR